MSPFTIFLLTLPGAFFAPVIHEFTKARVAYALGDITVKNRGYLTWNPLKYFEPIGFFFMLYFRLGWGQPVPISPIYFKDKRKGVLLTYLTPMLVNLLVGIIVFTIWVLIREDVFIWWAFEGGFLGNINFLIYLNSSIEIFVFCNIALAVFNLIPVHPMGMSKILAVYGSPDLSMRLMQYEKPMQIILIFLMLFDILQRFLFPIVNTLMNLVRNI